MMTGHGGFLFDTERQTIMFGPMLSLGSPEDALMIGRTMSGPHSVAHLITSRQQTHDTYGPGSAQYALPYALHQYFQMSGVSLWCLSSACDDLFDALRQFMLTESEYPHMDELRDTWQRLDGLLGCEYKLCLRTPDDTIKFNSVSKLNHAGTFGIGYLQDRPDAPPGTRYCLGGGLIDNGPLGEPGPSPAIQFAETQKPKQPSYRNLGRTSNATKRW